MKEADTLTAYIKCVEALKAGNGELRLEAQQTRSALEGSELPEVTYVMEQFLPESGVTLAELEQIAGETT